MGHMTDGYVAWVWTLAIVGPTIAVCGLLLLLGHVATETRLARVARWQAKDREATLAIKREETAQEKARQAVAEAQDRRA